MTSSENRSAHRYQAVRKGQMKVKRASLEEKISRSTLSLHTHVECSQDEEEEEEEVKSVKMNGKNRRWSMQEPGIDQEPDSNQEHGPMHESGRLVPRNKRLRHRTVGSTTNVNLGQQYADVSSCDVQVGYCVLRSNANYT